MIWGRGRKLNNSVEWCHPLQNCWCFFCCFEVVVEDFSATAVSFNLLLSETTDRSEGSLLLVPIYYMHIMSSKEVYFKKPFWKLWKQSIPLKWWKPLCQAKLQRFFSTFPIMSMAHVENGDLCMVKWDQLLQDRLQSVGTRVTHSGTKARMLSFRMYQCLGKKEAPCMSLKFLRLCHQ